MSGDMLTRPMRLWKSPVSMFFEGLSWHPLVKAKLMLHCEQTAN